MDSRVEQHTQFTQAQQASHYNALQAFLKSARQFQLANVATTSEPEANLEQRDAFHRQSPSAPTHAPTTGLSDHTTTDATPHHHKKAKKKHRVHPEIHVPPELITLVASGYLGTLNPALTAGLTNRIDSQFFWNFTMLDFIGMGLPRVSRSLKRGALPYDPDKDPEAQRREGFDKWLYIKKKQTQNANWPNLYEEFLREAQAAPGSLFVPAIVFSSVPFISRFKSLKPLVPPGRRALLMSTDEAQQHANHISAFMRLKPPNIASPNDEKGIQALGRQYVEHTFSQIPHADATLPVDVMFHPKRSDDPYYHVSHRQLETLKKHLGSDSKAFLGVGKALHDHPGKVNLEHPLRLNGLRLNDLIREWADVQGKLLAYDVKHGMGSAMFGSQPLKQEHAFLTAKQQMLFGLMHQASLQVNSMNNPHTRLTQTMGHLPLVTAQGTTHTGVLPFLRTMDKTRDLMSDGLRNYFRHNKAGTPEEAFKQTVSSMKGFKAVLSMGSAAWMMGWMWYLAHAIQSGREYPANRLVSESINAPKTIKNELPGFGEVNLSPVEEAAAKAGYLARQTPMVEGEHQP